MKKRLFALILAVLMTAALCACGGDKAPSATPGSDTPTPSAGSTGEKLNGGEITVGIAADLDTSLDPHVSSSSAGTREVLFNIFEGLVKPNAQGDLIPAVAESWSVNEAADEFTYVLRENVRFHNGQNVTVGDVVYSLSRAAGLETDEPLVADVKAISAVEATDEKTVVVSLSAPDTEFNSKMTVAIVPEGSDPNVDVIGTGPLKFASRTPQESIVLEKFQDYWGQGAIADRIVLKVIPDAQTMVMSLRSGAIDMAKHLAASQIVDLKDLTILEDGSNIIQALYLNNDFEPFRDLRVRQALCYAIDRQAVIDLAVDGHGTPVGTSMLPAMNRYQVPELVDYYQPDAAKAKELLKEAGYENLSFTITVSSEHQTHVNTAQVLVEQLRAVGVDAKLNLVEWATWLKETYQGRQFEATVVGMDTHSLAASGLLARFVSDSAKNFINFNDPDYDEAYAKAMATVDESQQAEYFKTCERILTQQAANVYIQDPSDFVVMQNDVGGYQFYPALYVMDLATLYRIG